MAAEWVLHLDRRKPKIMSEPKVQQLERVLAEAQLQLTETPVVLQEPEPEPSVQLGVWRRTGTS